MTDPWVKFKGEEIDFPSPTPEPPDYIHEVFQNVTVLRWLVQVCFNFLSNSVYYLHCCKK